MGAVSRAEGIVYINLCKRSKLLCKFGIVLFLARIKADILEENTFACLHGSYFSLRIVADDIGSKCNLAAEIFIELIGNYLKGEFLLIAESLFQSLCLSLCLLLCGKLLYSLLFLLIEREAFCENVMRLAHMRAEDNISTLLHEVFDSRQSFNYSLVARDDAILLRNIEIAAHKHFFACNINIFNGFLVVIHKRYLSFLWRAKYAPFLSMIQYSTMMRIFQVKNDNFR